MSRLWPFDDIFDISIPSGGSEFDILMTAFLSAIVPFLVLTCAIQLFCWICCSGSSKKKGHSGSCNKVRKSDPKLVAEARRWLRQATHDRQAAANDFSSDYPAFEWVCFKCHQSAEKAMKAAALSTGELEELRTMRHDLVELLHTVSRDEQLENVITDLQNCVGFVSSMRYPDKHPFPKVPHDAFTRDQAELALSITDVLLQHVSQHYLDVK